MEVNVKLPMFWDHLNDIDKARYLKIQETLSSSACKHRRHQSKAINNEIISSIKAFIIRGDDDDWRRSLVCGIGWINNSVVINTRQLRILVAKSKSSINAMFQKIGYSTVPANSEVSVALSSFYPTIKGNFAELRKWTVRSLVANNDENRAKNEIYDQDGEDNETQKTIQTEKM